MGRTHDCGSGKLFMDLCNFLKTFRTLFLLLLVTDTGKTFNILTAERNFIRNPQGLKNVDGNTETHFFGYDFTWKLIEDEDSRNVSILIGSPKGGTELESWITPVIANISEGEDEPNKPGDLFSCGFSFDDVNHTCQSISPSAEYQDDPALLIDGDSMGLSLMKPRPNFTNDEITACAPLRARNCTSEFLTQGSCFSSKDYGKTWMKETKQASTQCPVQLVDLIFVLDGSGSVTASDPGNFDMVKTWVKTVAGKFDIREFAHVGVIQYSHWYRGRVQQPYIKTEIRLGQFQDQSKFEEEVDKIVIQGYTTYTAHAINKTVDDFMQSKRFNDTATKKVMILLTDGRSNDADDLTVSAAYARSLGITIFAVGVAGFSEKELQIIATGEVGNDLRVYGLEKFSDLQQIVESLQKSITGILEGGVSGNKTNDLQNAETGFGGAVSQNGRLYLGAVGAYDWSGTVTKYDDVNDDQPDIPNYAEVQKVLPDRTKESYMGYSVTTGNFVDRNTEYVATGAPRYKLMGAVVVYRPINNDASFNDHVTLMGNKRQLGSYFGGSVLSTDVNGDGLDDLFVGAPLYVHENFDEGRVFVFISTGATTLNDWKAASYAPLELSGDNLPGGRFGTAMADAGDLNRDGYNDVIVGAPLTDNDRGAVFVYHGTNSGMDTKFKQKILASEMTGVTLKYFGQSLQGGVDLDGNKYPDIAVGAPKSDTVVIFRSRPVVIISPQIKYYDDTIDIFECIDKNYENCSRVEVCFTASGVSVENTIGIKFNVTIDTQKVGADKRLEFREGQENPKPTWSQEVNLTRDMRTCFTKDLHMKRSVKDYDSGVITEVEYDLLSSHTAKPLSSVRDPSISNKKTATLKLIKNCGAEGKCVYDLRIDASLNVPEYKTEKQEDLTEGGKVLVVDQKTADTPVTVHVNLSNNAENAFDTRIKVTYTSLISLSAFTNKIGYPASNSCVVEDSDPVDQGNGFRMQILRYNYKTNIMRPSAWCYFEFSLIIENLRKNGGLETFSVNVTAYTSDSSSSSEERNSADNSWALSPQVRYRSDFDLKKKKESQISFNYTTEAANITSITEIGNGTQDIEVEFELNGKGYSNIPTLDASLTYPLKTSHDDRLLYLYKVECAPKQENSKASCFCDQSLINPYNLTLEVPNENNTNGSYVEIFPPRRPIEASSFDCYTGGEKNFTCETLKCRVNNLFQSDQIIFKAYFRLWKSSITFNGSNFKDELNLHSQFEVNTNNSRYIIDENGNKSQSKSHEIVWVAKKFESSTPPEATENLWIYIVAAIGGLLLLIILVVILWRVGFFKSKYADMKKDAQEDIADETEFAGNANGSQVEMAG